MRLFLIRHGEMAGAPFVRPARPVTGCLTEAGMAQAGKAARALGDEKVDGVLSSSYGRALQTAEILFAHRGIPIEICDFLCEWLPSEAVQRMDREEFDRLMEREQRLRVEELWKTESGEGKFEMYARIVPPLLKALAAHGIRAARGGYVADPGAEDRCIAIVAHGGSLNIVLNFLINRTVTPWNGFEFALTGVAEVTFASFDGIHYPQLVIPPRSPGPDIDSD